MSVSQPTGVIHDIGYRHYEGRRLGRGHAFTSLMAHGLRGVWGLRRPARAKIMPFTLAGIMLMPAAASIMLMALSAGEGGVAYPSYTSIMQVVVAIFLAAQSPYLVAPDLRFRVLPLYLSRPVQIADYVGAKLAAMAIALYALIAVPLTVEFVGELLVNPPGDSDVNGYVAAMVAGVLHAVLLSAVGLALASFTPRRGLGVASVIAFYLLTSAVSLALGAAFTALSRDSAAMWALLINPFFLVEAVQTWLFGTPSSTGDATVDGPLPLVLVVVVTALAIGGLFLRYRSAASR
ncbi:ABC transporter permease [Thermopolyspora sp. NPDC052614]|uniref:ABC transporter permease n=1 Tax=Thermopolyspora sp. NPDC052614 TaxID=3155682 RepID=UPI00341A270B